MPSRRARQPSDTLCRHGVRPEPLVLVLAEAVVIGAAGLDEPKAVRDPAPVGLQISVVRGMNGLDPVEARRDESLDEGDADEGGRVSDRADAARRVE